MCVTRAFKLIVLSLVVVFLGSTNWARAAEEAEQEPVSINKIYWWLHPYCWSLHGLRAPEGREDDSWNAEMARELWLHTLRIDLINTMGPDEALIIYPIGSSRPMRQLEEHAKRVVGDRCFIMRRRSAGDEVFKDVEDPIRRFLDDESWTERDEWLHNMLTDFGNNEEPEGVAEEMEAEMRAVCKQIGYDWPGSALEVAYYQRMIAYDIEKVFRERGLVYDPQTVECVASGEGFEECAMTWKSMVARYLGLAHPIDNDYELSLSGFPYLRKATFKERIALSNDARLFLWEGEDAQVIALFARAQTALGDPQFYAKVPIDGPLNLEVRTFTDLFWEGKAYTYLPRGYLYIPVFTATRGGGGEGDGCFYLIGTGESYEDFRARLAGAEITTEPN